MQKETNSEKRMKYREEKKTDRHNAERDKFRKKE